MDLDGSSDSPHKLSRPSTFRGSDRLTAPHAPLSTAQVLLETTATSLERSSGWSTSLAPTLRGQATLGDDDLISAEWQSMAHRARLLKQRYGLPAADAGQSRAQRLAATACEQVILDTTLSSHLFSPRTILGTEPSVLSRPNEPLPAHLEPPSLQFSYFRPMAQPKGAGVATQDSDEDDEHDWKRPNLKSVGVRMLLSEWHVGSDPAEYAWNNPYVLEPNAAGSQSQVQEKMAKRKGPSPSPFPPRAPPTFQSSQAAPAILSTVREGVPSRFAATVPAFGSGFGGGAAAKKVSFSASQPIAEASSGPYGDGMDSQSQSQMGAATQVVPGAWGGRPAVAKDKKKAKKRMSGF